MNILRNIFGASKPTIEGLLKSRNVDGLIEALHHDDPQVRHKAAAALAQIGAAKAFEPVTLAIEQGRVKLDLDQRWIKDKLHGAYAAESIVKLLDNGDVVGAVRALGNIGSFIAASYAVGTLSEKNGPWLNDFLTQAFEDHFKGDVIFILARKGEIPLDLVFPTISCNTRTRPSSYNERVQIAFLLGLIPDNKFMTIPREGDGFYFKEVHVSDIAMDILRKPGNRKNLPQYLNECINVLKNGTYETRLKAIDILEMIGDPAAIEPLQEAAKNDQGYFVHMSSNDLSEGRTEYQIRDKAKGVITRLSK